MSDGHEAPAAGHGGEHREGDGYKPVPLSKILTPIGIVLGALIGIDMSSGGDHAGGDAGGHDAGHGGGGHDLGGHDSSGGSHDAGHTGGHDAHPPQAHGDKKHAEEKGHDTAHGGHGTSEKKDDKHEPAPAAHH